MIVELLTFFMILAMGALMWIGLSYTHTALLDALTDALPAAFVNNYTAFNTSLVYWLPAFILLVAIATFFIMSLRKKESAAYGY